MYTRSSINTCYLFVILKAKFIFKSSQWYFPSNFCIRKVYHMCDYLTLFDTIIQTQNPRRYIILGMYKIAETLKMAYTANLPTSLFSYQRERHYFKLTHRKLHEFKQLNQFVKE